MTAENVTPDSLVGLWKTVGAGLAIIGSWFVAAVVWLAGRSYRAEFTDRFTANEAKMSVHDGQIGGLDKRLTEAETKQTRHEERSQNQGKQLDRLEGKIDWLIEQQSKS